MVDTGIVDVKIATREFWDGVSDSPRAQRLSLRRIEKRDVHIIPAHVAFAFVRGERLKTETYEVTPNYSESDITVIDVRRIGGYN
ncbi:MAG: hypothetical protein ABIH37_04275 [archaeon]